MDGAFKAISDPTRRKILRMLSKEELTAGQIASEFGISGPSISHHLSVLKNADLVEARREGQQIVYSLNTTVVQDLFAMVLDIFSDNPENNK